MGIEPWALGLDATFAHHNMSAMFDFNQRFTEAGTLSKVGLEPSHIYLPPDGRLIA